MKSSTLLLMLFAALLLAAGCGATGKQALNGSRPDRRLLERDPPLPDPSDFPTPRFDLEPVTGELTLRQALALALLHNPALTAFSWEVRAKEAEALQAGLRPNPELGVEVENFAGSGEYAGTGGAETTVSLSQLIELGGKRAKRRQTAVLKARLVGWDYETKRLDVLTATTKAFVAVLAAQRRLAQAEELGNLAERFFRTVSERVEAGKVSPVAKTRAQVTLSTTRTDRGRADLALQAARQQLAALWGKETAAFERVVGSLEEVEPVPPQERLAELLEQNPEVARWETELQERDARLALQRAKAIPDLTLFAGGRHFRESAENGFVAGFSIPLPLFDRNQGGIAAADAARRKARQARRAALKEAQARLAAGYRDLSTAALEARTLREQVLPAAEESFEAVNLGYRSGKFGFLEVLDTQRTLFEVKGQYVEALAAYHRAKAEVERVIGSPVPGSTFSTEPHDDRGE